MCPVSTEQICPVPQNTSVLFQQKICPVSTEHIFSVGRAEICPLPTIDIVQPQIRGWAQNHQNGPKWVQNGRQVSRMHPNESYGRSRAFATGPVAQNSAKQTRNSKSACSRPSLLSWTAPNRGAPVQTGHLTGPDKSRWAILFHEGPQHLCNIAPEKVILRPGNGCGPPRCGLGCFTSLMVVVAITLARFASPLAWDVGMAVGYEYWEGDVLSRCA